jgi:hypothetical protein
MVSTVHSEHSMTILDLKDTEFPPFSINLHQRYVSHDTVAGVVSCGGWDPSAQRGPSKLEQAGNV